MSALEGEQNLNMENNKEGAIDSSKKTVAFERNVWMRINLNKDCALFIHKDFNRYYSFLPTLQKIAYYRPCADASKTRLASFLVYAVPYSKSVHNPVIKYGSNNKTRVLALLRHWRKCSIFLEWWFYYGELLNFFYKLIFRLETI